MITIGYSVSLAILSFVVAMLSYPHVISFAKKHNIVDNPNARKLQRVPIPVMGGTVVFLGLFVSFVILFVTVGEWWILKILGLLTVMFAVGVWDDLKDVPAPLRFLIESALVWLIIILLDVEINDFHGFWGIGQIDDNLAIPLSIVAGVGIINAINLIDGVDGYCSSYGIMSCIAFAIIFYQIDDMLMFTLAIIAIGAIIPFFFHNVFGKTSKMFLGDGGSLMLGMLLTFFLFSTLSANSPCAAYGKSGLSLVALTLAILAIPVFDTLRVMSFRVFKGFSPFKPDKTHLHHLFIEMNFSHLATSLVIVLTNMAIILILLVLWSLHVSIDWQVYSVIILALLVSWAFYFFMEWQEVRYDGEGSKMYKRWRRRGVTTHISSYRGWQAIRKVVDSRFLGGAVKESEKEEIPRKVRRDPRIQ